MDKIKRLGVGPVEMALAKTGIDALVDEATGYQYFRPPAALMDKFRVYLNEAIGPWVAAIPKSFWQQVFRLLGDKMDSDMIVENGDKIVRFIYNTIFLAMPKEEFYALLGNEPQPPDEFLSRACRALRMPEPMSTGNQAFDLQVHVIEGLMRAVGNMKEFKKLFESVTWPLK